MNAWKPILLAIAILAATSADSEGKATPCKDSVGGTWAFGRAPKGCDLAQSKADILASRYKVLTFDLRENTAAEQQRYMDQMHAFLKEAADYYLDERRTRASNKERAAWRRAVMALAHQESYWSHYRLAKDDGKLKMMRGDSGYGHGIMQIDERWHPKIALSEKGEDITANIIYGLDIFFREWERAENASCVSKDNLEQRAKAAYSAYNGGPGSLCRWTNSKDKWARNDKNFANKFKDQEWQALVSSPNLRSSLDVSCLVEGNEGCGRGVAVAPLVYRVKVTGGGPASGEEEEETSYVAQPGRTRQSYIS